MLVQLILVASILLQIAAALLALQLMRVTGKKWTWMLIAAALFLMAIPQGLVLFRLIPEVLATPPFLLNEFISVFVSCLIFVGFAKVGSIFFADREEKNDGRADIIEEFRKLIENLPDTMPVVNPTGEIILTDAQLETFFGYSENKLIGQPVEILEPELLRAKHTTHCEESFLAVHKGRMGSNPIYYAQHKNGLEIPVDVTLNSVETDQVSIHSRRGW